MPIQINANEMLKYFSVFDVIPPCTSRCGTEFEIIEINADTLIVEWFSEELIENFGTLRGPILNGNSLTIVNLCQYSKTLSYQALSSLINNGGFGNFGNDFTSLDEIRAFVQNVTGITSGRLLLYATAKEYLRRKNKNTRQPIQPTASNVQELGQGSSGGQGFQSDPEIKRAVENYAMERCRNYFTSKEQGYTIPDPDAYRTNPYDLRIAKDGEEFFVEVKGLQATGDTVTIILTENEVKLSQTSDKMILFIVHSIVVDENKKVEEGSGKEHIIRPWKVEEEKLKPISYNYKITLT